MKKVFFLLLVCPLLFWQCGGARAGKGLQAKGSGVHFVQSRLLVDVLNRAKAEGKLVFVDFYTDWCLPCKMMDKDVFTDGSVAKALNKDFLSYKVDGEGKNGKNLAFLYQVKAYPTLLFMDEEGRVLERKEGAAAYPTELLAMANRALERHKKKQGEAPR